ncbi:hypothetical protein Tco_1306359 [Tanacetum coccineum]
MTRRTKSYGSVKFGDEIEQIRVMTEMNRRLCSTTRMRIKASYYKNVVDRQRYLKVLCGNCALCTHSPVWKLCSMHSVLCEIVPYALIVQCENFALCTRSCVEIVLYALNRVLNKKLKLHPCKKVKADPRVDCARKAPYSSSLT